MNNNNTEQSGCKEEEKENNNVINIETAERKKNGIINARLKKITNKLNVFFFNNN